MKAMIITLLSVSLLTACGSNGGNGGGQPGYTHNELARLFADELNLNSDTAFDLVKKDTEQFNYIVIYDVANDSYDAVNIGTFKPGDDPVAHLNTYRNYVDLDVIPGYWESYSSWDSFCSCYESDRRWVETSYRDRRADIVFEKTAPTPKDRLTMAALEEAVKTKKAADILTAKFGMSQERSHEVAELAFIWNNMPDDQMTDKDHDEFAANILGRNFTEYRNAIEAQMSGDASELNAMIAETAEFNGLSPEKANAIVNEVFGYKYSL